MSLKTDFETLISNIELPPSSTSLVSGRYATLGAQLKGQLPHVTIKQIGSFQRKTKIKPGFLDKLLDLDMACIFADVDEWTLTKLKPRDLMMDVMKALHSNKTYKAMRPRTDAPTVIVEYADNILAEIVPCLRANTKDDTRPPHYYIAADQNTWKTADYDYDATYISWLNQKECGERLTPSIKLIKALLRPLRRFGLSSFQVEVLAVKTLPQIFQELDIWWGGWGYQDVLASYLCHVPRYISLPLVLPGSKSDPLPVKNPSDIGNRFMALGNKARELNNKSEAAARMFWKQRFGTLMPG